VIIGGAKVADKLGVLTELMKMADKVIVGGRMAFTFLAQKGVALGQTHIEADLLDQASKIVKLAEDNVRPSPARTGRSFLCLSALPCTGSRRECCKVRT
jgi:phosphoglycerate kinase